MIEKKLLLSEIRNGDFTHPGEIEAINMVMDIFPKCHSQQIIDVGCGLGGTADFISRNGWGKVTGIDIDKDAISYAKAHYPHINIYECDVLDLSSTFAPNSFDISCLFCSFYCFKKQFESLKTLSTITKRKGKIAIFDYSTAPEYSGENPFLNASEKPFKPIEMKKIYEVLLSTGWKLTNFVDITNHYKRWYIHTIDLLNQKKQIIINVYGHDPFYKIYNGFNQLLDHIKNSKLGGVILWCEKN